LSNSRVVAAAPHPAGSADAAPTKQIYVNARIQFKEKVSAPPDRHIEKGFGLWYHWTVQRTSVPAMRSFLQNRDVLERFQTTTWRAVGLEMEGGHYQRAISAAMIRGHIPKKRQTALRLLRFGQPAGQRADPGLGQHGRGGDQAHLYDYACPSGENTKTESGPELTSSVSAGGGRQVGNDGLRAFWSHFSGLRGINKKRRFWGFPFFHFPPATRWP